jgi:two-component system, sensor histidine kinase and response regulator
MKFFNSPNDPGNLEELQRRIAETFAWLTLISIVVFGISDYLLEMSSFLGKVRILYFFLFLGCLILMVRNKKFFLAMNLMLGLVLSFSVLNYFFNDGYRGPTIFNLYVFVVAVAIFFKRPYNLVWMFLSVGIYAMLFFLEINGSLQVQHNYGDLEDLFLDNVFTLIACAVFIFIGIQLVIINYQKQNQNLSDLRIKYERNLEELSLLNQKKNQLIAILSHDLRGPVGTLGATLELVDQGVMDSAELDEVLKSLKSQSFHLSNVLDNTLTWVTAELQEKEPQKHKVDLSKLTEEVIDTMQVQASRKNQLIEFSFFGGVREVELAVQEVKIILKNLLDNAIKFSPEGNPIYLRVQSNSGKIRWEVVNSGEVVPPQERSELFDLNVKSSFGTQQEKGTGIGLSLCRKIAERIAMKLGYEESEKGENVFFLESDQVKPKSL